MTQATGRVDGWGIDQRPASDHPTPAPQQTPPATPEPRQAVMRQCQICLHRGPDLQLTAEERIASIAGQGPAIPPDAVSAAVVRWRDPLPGHTFQERYRCEDHVRCRDRVEAFGDFWPIDDGTPPTRPPAPAPITPPVPAIADDELDFGA
jgi:hypothetical protein